MATMYQTNSPEHGIGGGARTRSMTITTPNPRRTQLTAMDRTQDGRKRRKLSHSPERESYAPNTLAIRGEVPTLRSQESSSSDQSASKWFSHANKNGLTGQQQSAEIDDDPPFYMSDRIDYVPNTFAASNNGRFGRISRFDSENEDLRGVIDDLTVENRRLRQLIRTGHRQRRDAPSLSTQEQDKLFEVRIHGLPSEKRRELEFLLKNFATGVHSSRPTLTTATSNASSGTNSGNAKSGAPQTDSGYASASGTTSGGTSNLATLGPAPVKPSTNRTVKTYLNDIPDTLLPKKSPLLSERAKQALVVRRLEQLFTGRTASPGEHDQPMQQQEISDSAARADRLQDAKDNKKRKAEGRREARVMPPDSKVDLDAVETSDGKGTSPTKERKEISAPGSPDQRPTRPLDLDIHRAQFAADNLQYLRHLGLSTPQVGSVKEEEESPWMFLTLLGGLAQLHTLNVTPEFVRRAIKKFSKRFELSKDGLKVRWTGGCDGTRFAADDEKAIEHAAIVPQDFAEDTGTGSSSKRSKTNSTSNVAATLDTPSEDKTSGLQTSSDSKQQQPTVSGISNLQASSQLFNPSATRSAFDYKPIVLREKQLQHEELQDSDESFDTSSGDSSGLVNALNKSNLNQRAKDEGVITFYHNPHFCSDFSSEMEPSNMRPPRPAVAGETLGMPGADIVESPLRYHDATYFTMQFAPKPFDIEKLSDDQRAKFDASLPKLPNLSTISEAGESETMPLEFEVCGLGGITPDDNFALDTKVSMKHAPTRGPGMIVKRLPFSNRRYLQKFTVKVESCEKLDLLPSKLPPPSYVFFTSSSSSDVADLDDDCDDDDDDDSDGSSSPFVDEACPAPPAFLQQFPGDSGEDHGDDEDNDMESEIDMLAIARQVNPEQIAEQERVYMLHQPGGLQRGVTGSLAATVGETSSASSMHRSDAANSTPTEDGSREESSDEDDDDDDEMDDA